MLYVFDEEHVKKEWEAEIKSHPGIRFDTKGKKVTPREYYIDRRFRKMWSVRPFRFNAEKELSLTYLKKLVETVNLAEQIEDNQKKEKLERMRGKMHEKWDQLLYLMELYLSDDASEEMKVKSRIVLDFLMADLINLKIKKKDLTSGEEYRIYSLIGHICRILREYDLSEAVKTPEMTAGKTGISIGMDEKEVTPIRIKAYLDRFIVGQDNAKRSVSLAVYNHFLRIVHPKEKLVKSNVLLIGPTGCGKTEIIRRLKKLLDIPVVVADFSGVVATPWRGKNKEESLSELLLSTDMDIWKAEHGIIFIDEFDKTASIDETRGYGIKSELQGQMLGMMEGTIMDVPDPRNENRMITMNTENILFICAGAFEGMERIVAKEKNGNSKEFGMYSLKKDLELSDADISVKHLIKYGFREELAGRFGELCVLNALTDEQMRKVILEAEDSVLEKYRNLFLLGAGKELILKDEAVDALICKMKKMKIGVRGLNAVLHEVLDRSLYEASEKPGKKVFITAENIWENS